MCKCVCARMFVKTLWVTTFVKNRDRYQADLSRKTYASECFDKPR